MKGGATASLLAIFIVCGGLAPCSRAGSYADPALLEMPWGNYSFVRQGWRGYVETVPAIHYLNGLGVVWGQSVPGKSENQMAADLAWAGFRRVRLEIPWGSVKWDETGLDEASGPRTVRILKALRAHGLRPLILLNANHLQPCPVQWRKLSVARDAAAGSRSIVMVGDLSGVQPLTATLMSLADGVTPGPLIERYSSGRLQTLELSKPLSRALKAGEGLRLAILSYKPLYPANTPEFERTAGGWLRYAALVANFVRENYGSDDFDLEIWNELTFGSGFLDINNYLDSKVDFKAAPESFHPGGRAWELANRTVALLHREHPSVKVIWGFSNTTFFHVAVTKLPPGLDGQSYHPYGTGRRCYADLVKGKEKLNVDGRVPEGCVVQPEGYAQGWQQTESLLRFLAPGAREVHPRGSASFAHYITEHGMIPAEIGIDDSRQAQEAKKKFLLRAPLLWLNKGLTALYVYSAYSGEDRGFGILERHGGVSSGMRALHLLTGRLAGAMPIEHPRQLILSVRRNGTAAGVMPGDATGAYLPQQDAVALLPFQVDATKFAIGAYVMTQDFPNDLAPQPYTIAISGIDGAKASVTYYSPVTGALQPVTVVARTAQAVDLELSLTDVPQLIEIQDGNR